MDVSKPDVLGRKRPLQRDIKDSPYYKMRALVRDLRPHFIELLKTPDFRNCQAADNIRQGIKVMMELYQELTEKPIKLQKCSNGDVGNAVEERKHDVMTAADDSLLDDVMSTPLPETQGQGTYVVGGSALGWNFITYYNTKPEFYGRTKEAFRAINPKSD